MDKLTWSVEIDAPKEKVWKTMLEPDTYRLWAAEFTAGSYYEGTWETGSKIKFLGPSKEGMVAEIAENRPYEYVSIKHVGFVQNDVEDRDSDEVKAWAPAYENYIFSENSGKTLVKVDLDSIDAWKDYFNEAWPRALAKLKEICQ